MYHQLIEFSDHNPVHVPLCNALLIASHTHTGTYITESDRAWYLLKSVYSAPDYSLVVIVFVYQVI